MKCEEIKNLIASDYIDGELDEVAREKVVRHLEICSECRQYEKTVRRVAVEPMRSVTTSSAPESIWHQIRRELAQERPGGFFAVLRGARQGPFRFSRAAVATVSLAAAILIAVLLVRLPHTPISGKEPSYADPEGVNGYIREQFLTLSYMGVNGTGSADNGSDYSGIALLDFGTVVEEYLL